MGIWGQELAGQGGNPPVPGFESPHQAPASRPIPAFHDFPSKYWKNKRTSNTVALSSGAPGHHLRGSGGGDCAGPSRAGRAQTPVRVSPALSALGSQAAILTL